MTIDKKVYRIYTDEDYRNSVYKENPEPEFINMYLTLITTNCVDKLQKLQMIKDFYNYATSNINLGNDYRILIKSRNIGTNQKSWLKALLFIIPFLFIEKYTYLLI